MTLSQMKVGQKAVVVGFDENGNFDANLMFDHGIYEGAELLICNIPPFGKDPIALEVNGSKLALRKALAEKNKDRHSQSIGNRFEK